MTTIIDSLEELHLGQGLLIQMLGFLRNPALSKDVFIKSFTSFRNPGWGKDFSSKSRIPFENIAKSVALLPWAMVRGSRAPRPCLGPGALCQITGWEAPASYATPPT